MHRTTTSYLSLIGVRTLKGCECPMIALRMTYQKPDLKIENACMLKKEIPKIIESSENISNQSNIRLGLGLLG